MKKHTLVAALLTAACATLTQAAPPTPTTTAEALKLSPAKKELIDKILKLQQQNIELLARNVAEGPVMQMTQQASVVLNRLPPEQREATSKGMQADLEKYLKETVPLVRERSLALAPTTIGKVLDEKFTDAELKEVIALLESPIYRKFSEQGFVMQRALRDKLISDTRSTVEPKVKSLNQSWTKRLQEAAPATTEKAIPPSPAAPGPTSK